MPQRIPQSDRSEQLLGEIESRITGMSRCEGRVGPGERVHLRRVPDSRRDRCWIEVEGDDGRPLGYLPRRIASWLAPLIDEQHLRLEGCVPQHAVYGAEYQGSLAVTLTVYLREASKPLIGPRSVTSPLDALHELVRRACEEAGSYVDPRLVEGLVDGLRPLGRGQLHPETRLLLALLPGLAKEKRVALSIHAMARLRALIDTLHVGPVVRHEDLALFPLIWPDAVDPHYLLLDVAIEAGLAAVEEVGQDGQVPYLTVINRCSCPLLILEGEILVGAKQNRVVNVTVLVAAGSRFTLPVSCVEQGRWRHKARDFRGAYSAPPSIRSNKLRAVQRNRSTSGDACSDQHAVWSDVAACLADLQVTSGTANLADGYVAAEGRLRDLRDRLELPGDTAGVVVTRGGRVVAVDLFGSPAIFASIKRRLLDAYLLDALRSSPPAGSADGEDVRGLLGRVVASARPRVPSLGEGVELEIGSDEWVGAVRLHDDQLCHLAVLRCNA